MYADNNMYVSFATDTTSVLPWMSLCKITINERLNRVLFKQNKYQHFP